MKILVYHWAAYSNDFLVDNIRRMGNHVDVHKDPKLIEDDENSFDLFLKCVKRGYDAVITYNYFKFISIACNMCSTPYISLTQDSPMLSLYDASTFFPCNYFFCFDTEQYQGMIERGIENVFYSPLMVDSDRLYKVAHSANNLEQKKYSSDISFVGSLYSEKNMLSQIEGLPDYIKGYLAGLESTQLQVPMVRFSQMSVANNVIEWLRQNLVFEGREESVVSYNELVDNLIDREVTVKERRLMLEHMKERDFKLYTKSDLTDFPYIDNCGTVDYYTQMPKVFALSNINLNVSLRSIRAGIPLRVLDVLACEGFLLTNAQPDLFMYFEEGKNIVTFTNLEEMDEKIDYYLIHEEERKRIAIEGRQVIKENFDFKERLKGIFKIVGLL